MSDEMNMLEQMRTIVEQDSILARKRTIKVFDISLVAIKALKQIAFTSKGSDSEFAQQTLKEIDVIWKSKN